ncbi:MAG TPA: rod shape-determining protein MreC [Fibrobacteres bacterium]|nr:rod shape-determining protein MreC [Fibrobacterota bacterium]
MHWIIRFIVYHRNLTTLSCIVFICLSMLSSGPVKQHNIARALTFSVFYPFQFYFSQTSRIKDIFIENRKLKEEIAEKSVELALLKESALEISRLETLLELENNMKYNLAAARVVAYEPTHISRSIIINVGKNNGIFPYMPVISSSGAVGKIIQSMGHMAMVQLIIDPSNRTGVLMRRNREIGILETENGNDFFIQCRKHADIAINDTVVTSGLGGVYPKGLTVGIVSRISESNDPLFKKAFIDISVDFNHLEEVFVMRVESLWTSFHDEADSLEHKK